MPAKKTDASTKINKTPIKTKKTALKKAAKGRVKTIKKGEHVHVHNVKTKKW